MITNGYGSGAGYALGAVVSSSAKNYKNGVDGDAPDTSTTSSFAWYDGAVQSSVTHNPNTSNATLYTTSYASSGSGTLLSATIADGRPRTVTYTSDLAGQTIRRDEADNNSAGDPHEVPL